MTTRVQTHLTPLVGLTEAEVALRPTGFWVGGDALSGDWRPALLAIGLFILLLISPYVPILNSFFGVQPLRNAAD